MRVMSRLAPVCTLLGALVITGCASSQAVPRPFPGAPTPPAVAAARPAEPIETAPGELPGEPSREVPPIEARPIEAPSSEAPPLLTRTSSLLTTALGLRGTPYLNGGVDPRGFDCSGFVRYVFAQVGQQLPREVRDQFTVGTPVRREDVQPGDLVFFETVSAGASHVGIALGNDEFVHAPSSRGVVRTERYTISYWASRWVGARRVG
jgi:cell wall-associated NlpC family hydrolase